MKSLYNPKWADVVFTIQTSTWTSGIHRFQDQSALIKLWKFQLEVPTLPFRSAGCSLPGASRVGTHSLGSRCSTSFAGNGSAASREPSSGHGGACKDELGVVDDLWSTDMLG